MKGSNGHSADISGIESDVLHRTDTLFGWNTFALDAFISGLPHRPREEMAPAVFYSANECYWVVLCYVACLPSGLTQETSPLAHPPEYNIFLCRLV